ncbi:hypothetical protein NMY22_g5581 [Coprinellus aureogranulatus]|nr:hypothetical protein NMY22_g5581 [Coprinellus aureogranulatus]
MSTDRNRDSEGQPPDPLALLDNMEEDELSFVEAPEDGPQTAYEKQLNTLDTYLKSLPYECETPEQMQRALEGIVSKICIAAKAKNWFVLSTWDGMLQCWLLMSYPIPKSTRAKLARLYYELTLLPGVEPRSLRNWAEMFSRLLASKSGSWTYHKLDPADLQLSWKPLWRTLKKELWPKAALADPQRNLVNILLYVAHNSKRFFPPEDVPEMLETFLPMFTQSTMLSMIPVITCFLPPKQTHLYIPALFRIWEAFNSSVMDDRLLEFCGELAEEHVAGKAGDAGQFAAEWKDVGIWTEWQWNLISGKALSSLGVPIGMLKNSGGDTSKHADTGESQRSKIKLPGNRILSISKLFIYSMRVDSEVRQEVASNSRGSTVKQAGVAAGSRALDTLEKLINSTETFFHPTNLGNWTPQLMLLLQRLSSDFMARWKEEEQPTCKVPQSQRLTLQIRRHIVKLLSTPALLGMFSKDSQSAAYAQGALRILALLEPSLIMPELLERAYGGLEVVNETHRTTAVLSTLATITRPLLAETVWLGGQKNLVPLLELCLPGIDLNDPAKTICATMFVTEAVKLIAIADVSATQVGGSFDDGMDVDEHVDHIPDGMEPGDASTLSREEERSLVKDSTASFAGTSNPVPDPRTQLTRLSDWVLSLFRRVFSLYENLPEEGGKKNTTGGKSEEAVLKSIKVMLDTICQQLSDPLFDLVLKLVYDYGTTNAKSNAVRAFGQVIASMAKVQPGKVMARFIPFCKAQIEEELRHGASSVRTTSTHAAIVKHKDDILRLLALLVEKTKSERGYTSTGRLITRILDSLQSVYPLDARFVNRNEWDDPKFMRNHYLHWGKMYEAKDVRIDWHTPSSDDIDLIIDILELIQKPALDVVETLLDHTSKWDNVARNDFCRYLHAARCAWVGLSTIIKLPNMRPPNPLIAESYELPEMVLSHLDVNCGFALSNPEDPRYQKVLSLRERFGHVVLRAASLLRQNVGGEDHIDALITVTRSVDTYLMGYCASRGQYETLQKSYRNSRDANKMWPRQKENIRSIAIQRANLYHLGRVYMHSLYRQRTEMDDKLIVELTELSLSPYTRIRRQAQSSLHTASSHFVRSTKLVLPILFDALKKGNDPDRMKGALYLLWIKGTAGYALADHDFSKPFLVALLECQHEDKVIPTPSAHCETGLTGCMDLAVGSEVNAYVCDAFGVHQAIDDLQSEFPDISLDGKLANEFMEKTQVRRQNREIVYQQTVSAVLEIATRATTHWRYVQMAATILDHLIRRDAPMSAEVGKFFAGQTLSPQPTIRSQSYRALSRILYTVKARTYSKSLEELWFDEWKHPRKETLTIDNPGAFLASLQRPVSESGFYLDKVNTGFLTWAKNIQVYNAAPLESVTWEAHSSPLLYAVHGVVTEADYFERLATLWSQESGKSSSLLSIRIEHYKFIKHIANVFGCADYVSRLLNVTSALISDPDKYRQRAGAEMLTGLLRGIKHWAPQSSDQVWKWLGSRLDIIYAQIRPDTSTIWQCVFHEQLVHRDPRRSKVMVDWLFNLPLEFRGESAFQMAKSVILFSNLVDALGLFFNPHAPKYAELFFNNADTDYAEIRQHLCHNLYLIMRNLWQPAYPSTEAFLVACRELADPLQIRQAIYQKYITKIVEKLPQWRQERLPPPRVSQSQYDKVCLTLLQWIWISAHGAPAHLIIPYIVPLMPEILRLSELSDNPEIQAYGSGALYILSALTPLSDFIEPILDKYVVSIESSQSWRTRLHGLPALVIFFYKNLLSLSPEQVNKVMRVLLDCLANENVEVREMASKVLSGVVRTSQRHNIAPLKNRFITLAKKTTVPSRQDPGYATALRTLHSAILGICALIQSCPYSVEPWLPPLTEVLAPHATDPPPISTTIRNCASEFKKTHQDTWHKDQLLFDEDQLQSLSTMLVGTSYYA